jgi:hypothetical protein
MSRLGKMELLEVYEQHLKEAVVHTIVNQTRSVHVTQERPTACPI